MNGQPIIIEYEYTGQSNDVTRFLKTNVYCEKVKSRPFRKLQFLNAEPRYINVIRDIQYGSLPELEYFRAKYFDSC